MGRIAGSILLMCLMSFAHANNSPEIATIFPQIKEDTPKGHHAFAILATDAENDPLTYRLTGPNANFFSVDSNTGEVKVLVELDRETMPVFQVTAFVSDGFNTATKEITIVLVDANDNNPIFQDAPYNVEYPENTPVGTSLFKATATDDDSGLASLVKYSIDEVIPNDGTSLFSMMEANGEVRLNGSLDYNTQSTFYRIKINATDGGGKVFNGSTVFRSSIAFAFITVLDVPDLDPQFIRLPYTASVEEGSPLGKSVFKVLAIDQDTGISDNIVYSIESSTAEGLFGINGDNGEILVMSEIDREAISDRAVVTLTVKATEANPNIHGVNANTTADVQITIIDINDNEPKFYMCGDTCVQQNTFTGEIFEHSSGTIPINMTVIDKDQGGRIKLTLDGVDKDVFSVTPPFTISESTVQLMVKSPLELDFEIKEFMVVQVIAEDQDNTTLRSTATVTIALKDTNDNNPKFPQDTYELQVPEHSPVDTVLDTITATDLDELDEGKITYRLLPASIRRYFDVDPDTGKVYVTNSSLIDREVRSLYSATLQARDFINNTGTTVLEITLIDINDQPPVMNREDYFALVIEGEQLELHIEATDRDDPETPNSQIVYGIVPSKYSDNFTIDAITGILTNSGELDREALEPDLKGKIELVVTATDKGDEPLNDTAKVIIDIVDINDNTPRFKEASYKFSVKEGMRGAFVGSVYAEDLDQTAEFNRISFSITEGSIGSFVIHSFPENGSYRGDISVDPDVELDYESIHKSFKLQVEAANLEEKAVVEVEVEVLDVNDERPEFSPATPILVIENTTITGAIGNFTAQDKDGNHSLVFELVSILCRCNGTTKPCDWFILEDTGEIIANVEHTVDYELCDQVKMEAQVVDEYTQKGENNSVTSGIMVINIVDINDNAPQFILSDSVFVVVSESASKGTSVASVTATDRDSGVNKQIDFEVTDVTFHETNNQTSDMGKVFEAVTTQQKEIYVGIIQSLKELNTVLKGKYLVTVVATDAGGLSTATVLEIFTVDKTFKIELRFLSSVEQVQANEEAIISDLTAATNAKVEVLTIRSYASESRASQKTIMEAYFIYLNGTAIDSDTVENILSQPEHFLILSKYGLTYIGNVPIDDEEHDPITFVLLGLVGGMIIVLAVLTTSLVCTRRSYRTKLKAANAMKSAAMVVTENQKSGPVVPGTNKYTMEGANPVLNLNIDTATDLGFDEDGSNVDRVSLNSLDDNMDMSSPEKDTMRMIREEDEENGELDYIEPLGAALAQRGLKKGQKKGPENTLLAFDNPAMSTTDL